jgi:nitrite reductase/ring-hydroxylating ferredoxin subunit
MTTEWHRVATTGDLETNGDRIITEIRGREIAVFRLHDDYFALANYCVHQGGPLCEGDLTSKTGIADDGWSWDIVADDFITCPWHSWKFDIETGQSIQDEQYRVPRYDVRVGDGDVYVGV